MMIRINTQGNVDTYTKPEGGMGGRIRPQDIFVLNTRFTGSGQFPAMTDAVASTLAANLRTTFPCNRIIALNGMSFDPTVAGYAFSGIGDPNVFALLTDFEKVDWNAGRATDPSRPPWHDNFPKAFPLAAGRGTSASCPPWRRTPWAPASEPASPHRTTAPGTSGRSPRTSTSRTPGSATRRSGR